ncbi:MAG: heme NO-binding domain-containing protein [Bacteroidota bacterium]|jgi:hypothetical protein
MYGLVNQAIQGLVIDNFGEDNWKAIKQKANVTEDSFLSNEIYDDSITFNLAVSASEVLNIPLADVLKTFGKYWIIKVGNEKYGPLMKSGGDNFIDFIVNLPNFHSRVMLIYSDIKPPEFIVEKITESQLKLHYYSTRQGLTDFMFGLIQGLGELYQTPIDIKLIADRRNGDEHDIFEIDIL